MWTLENVGVLLEWVSLLPGDNSREGQASAKGKRSLSGGAAERCCKVRMHLAPCEMGRVCAYAHTRPMLFHAQLPYLVLDR